MSIKPRVANETTEETEIRVWFSTQAQDPKFIREIQLMAQDLLAIKRMIGARAATEEDDVVLKLGSSIHRIPKTRWSYFAKRGYIAQSVRPSLSPHGEKMLKVYAYLIHEASTQIASF